MMPVDTIATPKKSKKESLMTKKTGFTIEQHEKLGPELQAMCARLGKIAVEVYKAYPEDIGAIAQNACDATQALRNILDNKVCAENRDLEDPISIYYCPGRMDHKKQE